MISTTEQACSVETLMDELGDRGIEALWYHTGGGNFAILVPLPNEVGELLITDYDGPLSAADRESDHVRMGWCVGQYDRFGEPFKGTEYDHYLYQSPAEDDPEYVGPWVDIDKVVETVVTAVERAWGH